MKVLITTSGIGSRLGNLTKYTNKALVRVGKMPAISYIIQSYPSDTKFIVTLGHHGEQVTQYLKMVHPDVDISYVNVDPYEGEGSSLLYSMFCAKDHLKEPFVFHACDSIVGKEIVANLIDSNWLGGFPSGGSSHYRTFNTNRGIVSRINEKGEKSSDNDYVGICGIKDYEIFWSISEKMLAQKACPSDYDAIHEMIRQGCRFDYKIFPEWKDIGNMDSLKKAREEVSDSFKILDKEEESIFLVKDKVVKFFHDDEICKNRVLRAGKMGTIVPKVISSSKNFYAYEYTDGELLSKFVTTEKIKNLLSWAKRNLWIRVDDDGSYVSKCKKFYKDKTISRVQTFVDSRYIEDKEQTINGDVVPSAKNLIEKVDFSVLNYPFPTMFHGDFILENILKTKDSFTLLDWRQDFGGSITFGDMNYDIAKLNHNLTFDHHAVYSNLFEINENSDEIRCDIMVSSIHNNCRTVLQEFCVSEGVEYEIINMLTAIIWLNMSPLHEHPLDKFLYYFGRYNLNKAINAYEKNKIKSMSRREIKTWY